MILILNILFNIEVEVLNEKNLINDYHLVVGSQLVFIYTMSRK